MGFRACIPDQFKRDFLAGVHQPGDVYKLALYDRDLASSLNEKLHSYTSAGELPDGKGYTRGGNNLRGFTTGHWGPTGYIDFADPVWESASFGADAALIYNASRSNKALVVFEFGLTAVTNGTFSVKLPPPGTTAVISWNEADNQGKPTSKSKFYGHTDRAVTSGGLLVEDLEEILEVAPALILANSHLSDDEKAKTIEEVEVKQAHLHYRFARACDHQSKNCPFSRGRRK